MKKYYEPGVLLVLKDPRSYQNSWFTHVIILEKTIVPPAEHVYYLFTSDGELEWRTTEWVHLYYKGVEDGDTDVYPEMDQEAI